MEDIKSLKNRLLAGNDFLSQPGKSIDLRLSYVLFSMFY